MSIDSSVSDNFVNITGMDIIYFIIISIFICIIVGLFLIVPSPLSKKDIYCDTTLCNMI